METRRAVTVDAVIPARNEVTTVAAVVEACRRCSYVRDVVVVDDGSTDGTGEAARAAGALVIRREAEKGSKADAMHRGVQASDADAVLFVDADCLGLTALHLEEICRPYVQGRATMSIGFFDYGRLNRLVLRLPPTTGERIIPRWVWDEIPEHKRRGWTIEIMINEVIAERHLPTVARTMRGVTHRTKRDKLGVLRGSRESWRMFWMLMGLPVRGSVRWRTYWYYLQRLTIEG